MNSFDIIREGLDLMRFKGKYSYLAEIEDDELRFNALIKAQEEYEVKAETFIMETDRVTVKDEQVE